MQCMFGRNPLYGAPLHMEAASSLRHVAAAHFIDVLDVFPADAIGRHGMLRRLGLAALQREQSRDDVGRIRRFNEIIATGVPTARNRQHSKHFYVAGPRDVTSSQRRREARS